MARETTEIDVEVERIADAIKAMRAEGVSVIRQQGYLKVHLLNAELFHPQDRTQALKKVNHQIGTSWSMNQVKKGDVTEFIGNEKHEQLIPVSELHGSAAVSMAASAPASVRSEVLENIINTTELKPVVDEVKPVAEKGVTVKVIPDGEIPDDDGGTNAEYIHPAAIAAVAAERRANADASKLSAEINGVTVTPEPGSTMEQFQAKLQEQILQQHIDTVMGFFCPNGIYVSGEYRDNGTILHTFRKTAESKEQIAVTNAWGHLISGFSEESVKLPDLTGHFRGAQEPAAQPETNNVTNTTATEENIAMPIGQRVENANATTEENIAMTTATATATNTTAGTNAGTDLVDLAAFLQLLAQFGAPTPILRQQAFTLFLETTPPVKTAYEAFQVTNPGVTTSDEMIYRFLNQPTNEAVAQNFIAWTATKFKADAVNSVSTDAKSFFSLTGDRDEGIRAAWLAVGGAVIGGGLETFASGSITVGSGVGVAAGAVAGFLLGDVIDSNIESDFGRMVLAGTVGMGLGAIGSRVGRNIMAGRTGSLGEATALQVDPQAAAALGAFAGL